MSALPEQTDPPVTMSGEEVRKRAVTGAILLAARGTATRMIGFVGTLVLARLLTPRDFGIVAFGTALLLVAVVLADGGLGTGLIRRREPPRPMELGSVVGFQVLATGVLVVIAALVALQFGRTGAVVAVMLLGIPIGSFKAPGFILLERELEYGRLVTVELTEIFVYYAWAVGTVLAGAGVWGMATAAVVRPIAGCAVMWGVMPTSRVTPRPHWGVLKPLLGFGGRFQASMGVNVAREQGRDVGIGAVAGLASLGIWSVALRLLQVPYLLFESFWRVSFPALSRLRESEADIAPVLERAMKTTGVAGGVVVACLVGSAPAVVPLAFGPEWHQVSEIVAIASVGVILSGPIGPVATGYLYAADEAAIVLRSTVIYTTASLVITFSLLPFIGLPAVGLGWIAQGAIDSWILGRRMHELSGARVIAPVALPVALCVIGAGAGWLLSTRGDATVITAAAGVLAPFAVFVCGLALLDRPLLRNMAGMTRRALSRAG
jgi:O-antigen/teichoic acid export membrane protein